MQQRVCEIPRLLGRFTLTEDNSSVDGDKFVHVSDVYPPNIMLDIAVMYFLFGFTAEFQGLWIPEKHAAFTQEAEIFEHTRIDRTSSRRSCQRR